MRVARGRGGAGARGGKPPCPPAPLPPCPSALVALLCWLLISPFALAQPAPAAPPPDLSPQVFEVARQVRCPVCQGESAAESNAGVAVEMRRIIAEQLAAGRSPEQILQFFVQRYGDWVLYEPPRRGLTLWVWLSPLIGFGLLALALWRHLAAAKARARATPAADVSDEEIARLEREIGPAGQQRTP